MGVPPVREAPGPWVAGMGHRSSGPRRCGTRSRRPGREAVAGRSNDKAGRINAHPGSREDAERFLRGVLNRGFTSRPETAGLDPDDPGTLDRSKTSMPLNSVNTNMGAQVALQSL